MWRRVLGVGVPVALVVALWLAVLVGFPSWKRRWRRRGRTADLVRRGPRRLAALTGARIGWAEPSSLGASAARAVAPGSAPTHAAPPLTADAGEPVPRGHLAATSVRLGRGASLGRPGAGRRLPSP